MVHGKNLPKSVLQHEPKRENYPSEEEFEEALARFKSQAFRHRTHMATSKGSRSE